MRASHVGVKQSAEAIANRRASRAGYRHSEETKKKIKAAQLARPGIRIGDPTKVWRKRTEFRLWREAVFARDNWTCQKCGSRGDSLHPHHIRNFAEYPELRFAIDNGITLCVKDHRTFHSRYGSKLNTRDQLMEFIG